MGELFLKILNMSVAAGWLVLVVAVLRLALRKAPKWIAPMLWGVVALRLIMPFSIESVLSLIPSAQTVVPETVAVSGASGGVTYVVRPEINSGFAAIDNAVNPVLDANFTSPEAVNSAPAVAEIAAAVWLLGLAVMLLYAMVSWMGLRNRVSTAVRLRDNVYQSEFVASPFVLGVFRPKIYLPYSISGSDAEYVIAHENAHIARRDTLIKPLGYLLLSVYWFNPLIWLAYMLLCRDIEYACDERVVSGFSPAERADYSVALVN